MDGIGSAMIMTLMLSLFGLVGLCLVGYCIGRGIGKGIKDGKG